MTESRVGTVERIHVASGTGGDPEPREAVEAVADRGLRGDRYFDGDGIYNEQSELEPSDITLIEAETLAAAAAEHGVDLEAGVDLGELVGERCRVGEATVEGTGRCEPCGYMADLAEESDAVTALDGRGGLDARIVESGTVAVGDEIVW